MTYFDVFRLVICVPLLIFACLAWLTNIAMLYTLLCSAIWKNIRTGSLVVFMPQIFALAAWLAAPRNSYIDYACLIVALGDFLMIGLAMIANVLWRLLFKRYDVE